MTMQEQLQAIYDACYIIYKLAKNETHLETFDMLRRIFIHLAERHKATEFLIDMGVT